MAESIRIFAPATVANVACGFDVMGFALDAPGDEMEVAFSDQPGVTISGIEGAEGLPLEPEKNVASVSLMAMQKALKTEQGFSLKIYKGVKPGSGVGSSAASAAGSVFGANELLGRPFSRAELVEFAMQGEMLASGAIHADNVAPSLMGGFVLIRENEPLDVISIHTPDELFATVIHPQVEVKTSESRAILPKEVSLKSAITQWGNVAALVAGLMKEDYELIGRSLKDGIVEPVRSTLIPGYDVIKKAAANAGSLGGSISGSGPSVFALSWGEETANLVAAAMREAYQPLGIDFEVYVSRVNPTGARVIES